MDENKPILCEMKNLCTAFRIKDDYFNAVENVNLSLYQNEVFHKDPNDRNIRLAPSLPPVEEVEVAMDGVATCVLLAAAEKFAD